MFTNMKKIPFLLYLIVLHLFIKNSFQVQDFLENDVTIKINHDDELSFTLENKQNVIINSTSLEPASSARSVIIFRCSVAYIDVDTFQTFRNLTEFTFSENAGVATIPEDLFFYNFYLESIDLTRNNLTHLAQDTFLTLINLKRLDLSVNKISVLPPKILGSLFTLVEFFMTRNELEEIPEGIFDNAFELRTIDLSYNRIESIPKTLFKNNFKLKVINLQGNGINIMQNIDDYLQFTDLGIDSIPVPMVTKKIFIGQKTRNTDDERNQTILPQFVKIFFVIPLVILLAVLGACIRYHIDISIFKFCVKYHNMRTSSTEDLVA